MRPRVLIVEDECDSRELFAEYLGAHGYDVTAVGTSAEARAATCAIPFDAVITDLLLDTHDVEGSWDHHDDLVEIAWPAPVLLVTGWRLAEGEQARRGVTAMASKPVPGKQMLDWLDTAVASRPLTADERHIARAYFTSIEQRDWSGFAALCTEDVAYRLPGEDIRFARTVTGRDALRAFTESTFGDYTDVTYEIGEATARPGYLTIAYRSTWSAGGASFTGLGTVFLQLREGAIAAIAVRLDPKDIVPLERTALAD